MLPESLQSDAVLAALDTRFADALLDASVNFGEVVLTVNPAMISAVCGALKRDYGFNRLRSVTAADYWPLTPRFEVVYHLHYISANRRLRLKIKIGEGQTIDSVTHIWKSANWYEREVFDLFGILFANHPNLERIMMPADWEGHPLRKDYPVHGYKYSYAEER